MAKNDWGDDDSDSYELKKDDGELILKSLAKIPYQTSRHLCVNTGLSIGTIIDHLDGFRVTKEAMGERVGATWVYFLPENDPRECQPPRKLFLGGTRGIDFRDADPKPKHTSKLKIGDVVVPPKYRPPVDDKKTIRNLPPFGKKIMDSGDRQPDRTDADPGGGDEPTAPEINQPSAHIKITESDLQRLAEINPDRKIIAEKLGVSYQRLCNEMYRIPQLRRAYEEGEKIYMKNSMENKTETTAAETPAASGEKISLKSRLTPELLEEAAFSGTSTARLAAHLGVEGNKPGNQIDAILYNKKNSELLAAWKRGKERRGSSEPAKSAAVGGKAEESPAAQETGAQLLDETRQAQSDLTETGNHSDEVVKDAPEPPEAQKPAKGEPAVNESSGSKENALIIDPRFANTLEHISTHGHSREKLEEVQNKLLEPARRIEFEFLGRAKMPGLTLSFDGDFFDLPKKQRDILNEMANLKDEYMEKNS